MIRTPWVPALGLIVLAACSENGPPTEPRVTTDQELRRAIAQWGVIPIGAMPPQNPAKVRLGRALFFDKILSGNRDISCATCHQPAEALADGMALAIGTGGTGVGASRTLGPGREFVPRGAPSLLNVGLGLPYMFWDGRLTRHGHIAPVAPDTVFLPNVLSDILAAQAMLPVLNRQEMRGEPGDLDTFGETNELAAIDDGRHPEIWAAIMDRLLATPEYQEMFRDAFPETAVPGLGFQHAAQAIAAFEREAFTRTDSPFDRYMGRDDAALTAQQKRGALLFFGEAQCGTCHNGPFIGGQSFANVGAPQVGPGVGLRVPLDLGRFEIEDFVGYRFAFRVAPLRNVELTAPYMHSGAYPSLEAVVRHYDDVPKAIREYDVMQLAPELRDSYHGDDATIQQLFETLNPLLQQPLDLTETEIRELVAFLKSLTDPSARDLASLVPDGVPSGLPVRD